MLLSLMLSYAVFDYKTLTTNIAEVTSWRFLNPDCICWKNFTIFQIFFWVCIIGDEIWTITFTAMQWWLTAQKPEIISKSHCSIIRERTEINYFYRFLIHDSLISKVRIWRRLSSETSVNFYQTTWHNNPEDSHLHTQCYENLKSH
jgi:hypothetical protein